MILEEIYDLNKLLVRYSITLRNIYFINMNRENKKNEKCHH